MGKKAKWGAKGRRSALAHAVKKFVEPLERRLLLVGTPVNVLVNNPSADTTTSDTQSETTLLAFGSTVLSSYNDSGSNVVNSTKFTGYARSTDGGTTFTDLGVLPTAAAGGDGGDPVLARDNTSGRIYLATLPYGLQNIVQIFRSDDGGVTFQTPVNAVAAHSGGQFDKEWIAVDNFAGAGQGNVYLVSRDFGSGNGIYLFRSTNQGTTWTGNQLMASGAGGNVQGAYVTVGPDHSVYVFWYDNTTAVAHIMMKRSTDQGVTFGASVTVATLSVAAGNGDLGMSFRSNAFPQAAVNPVNGNLYVVYNDKGAGTDRGNIYFTQSTTSGATWSAPTKVNDDATTTDQWQPALAVQPNGTRLFVGFYDRRNDPANTLIDTYGAVGDISGNTVTFEPNIRITSQSFSPVYGVDPKINSVYMGDYDGAAADNSGFYYTWADNRDNSLVRAGKQANVRLAKISTGLSVIATTPAAGAVLSTPPTDFTVTFSDPVNPATLSAAGFTVNAIPADSVTLDATNTIATFHFNTTPVTAQGLENFALAAGAATRASDGSASQAFAATFHYDLTPTVVVSTTPPAGSAVSLPFTTIDVTFNEALDPASVGTNDLVLSQGSVTAAALLPGNKTVEYTLGGINTEGTLSVSLPAGAVADSFGNAASAFSETFTLDVGVVPFPAPLTDVQPQGSSVFTGTVSGTVGFVSDTDSYTINLDAGQSITVIAGAGVGLLPTLQLFDPLNPAPIATASAAATGQDAVLQSVPVTTAGVYTIVVASGSNTVGAYSLNVTLNAATEMENHGGAPNDTIATAQNLDPSFQGVGGAGQRAAVLGSNGPAGSTSPIFSDDFESGLAGFVLDNTVAGGLWHLSTGRGAQTGHSPTQSLYFGHGEGPSGGGNYNTGARTAGTATSPTINLPVGNNTLSFNYVLQTENNTTFDQSKVQISQDGGATYTTLASYNGVAESLTWKAATIDLSAYSGKAVKLRWSFDTVDGVANTYEGWYVDDVKVTAAAPAIDNYRFTLNAGDTVTVAVKSTLGAASDVKLLDSAGNVLVQSLATATNLDKFVADVVAPYTGTYYAVVTGASNTTYDLIVSRNAGFDTETNDTTSTAQKIWSKQVGNDQRVIGNIGGTSTSAFDFKEVALQPVDGLHVNGVGFGFSVDNAPSQDAVFGITDPNASPDDPDARAVLSGNATGVLTMNFDRPTTSVSFTVGLTQDSPNHPPDGGGDDGPSVLVRLYDLSGALVGSQFLPINDLHVDALLLQSPFTYSGAPIGSIQIDFGQADGTDFVVSELAVTSGNTVDTYAITGTAGASLQLSTSTPGDGPGEFVNTLNPRIRLLSSTGVQLALDDNSAPDGRNALLNYTFPSTGTYYVEVSSTTAVSTLGDYVLDVQGATVTYPPFAVTSITPAAGAVLAAAPTQATVVFSAPILLTTLTASDLQLDGAGLSTFTMSNDRTLVFTLPAGLTAGTHTFTMNAGSITDAQGISLSAFTSSFTVDASGPRVIASSIQEGDVKATGSLTYSVTFNRAMLAGNLDATDFTLKGNLRNISYAPTSFGYASGNTVLNITYASLPEDTYTLTLLSGPGRFEDSNGHDLDGEPNFPMPPNTSGDGVAGGNFVVDFTVDAPLTAMPPVVARLPLGSTAYDSTTTGAITTGADTDSFTINLDAGQTLTVWADPSASLQPTLQVTDPSGTVIGAATSAGAGKGVVIETLTAAAAGIYTITMGSAGGTIGLYTVGATLNAAQEIENHGGAADNTIATAQSLDASFSALPGQGPSARVAVAGSLTSADTADYYSFSVAAGLPVSLVLSRQAGSNPIALGVYDAAGNLLATGSSLATNVTSAIDKFTPTTGGTYYVQVSGGINDYTLVLGRNAAFDLEPNGVASPQDVAGRPTAVGYITAGANAPTTAGTVFTGARDITGTPLSLGIAADGSFVGPTIGAKFNGVEYWRYGVVVAGFTVAFNGANYTNEVAATNTSAFPVVLEDFSSGTLHGVRATGTINSTLGFQRTIWWNDGDAYAMVSTTLTNKSASALATVAILDNQDPDPGDNISTSNDVVIDAGGHLVVGSFAGVGGIALASLDSRAVASVGPNLAVTNPFTVINNPVDPNGVSSDSSINLAFNIGALGAGQSTSTTYALVFGSTQAAIQSTYAAVAPKTASGTTDDDRYAITVSAGDTIGLRTYTPGDGPAEFPNTLDPALELYDPNGVKVAGDDNSAPDGRNAVLNYIAPVGGTYVVRVLSSPTGQTKGEYVLALPASLSLGLPSNVAETAGVISGTVSVPSAPASDLLVTLSSADPSRLGVPASVIIPAGQTSVAVPLTVIDNTLLDGAEPVVITAAASGYASAGRTVTVHDNETATLTVSLPAGAREGDAPVTGTLTASAAPTRDITVQLSSSNTARATVPATVVLKAGQTTATFPLSFVDNSIIDGTQVATITAGVENWTGGSAPISIDDNDNYIAVTLPPGGWEGQTLAGAGTVRIGGTLASNLVVNLLSSDTTELAVPATVTILAGQTTATFNLSLLTDGIRDGSQTAAVTASAAGLISGSSSLVVHDVDLDHILFDTISSPRTAGVAFTTTAHAYNASNEIITLYAGSGVLSASGLGGNLPAVPASVAFSAGTWTGSITINALDPAAVLAITSGAATGVSNSFAVQPGAVASLVWSAVPGPQTAGVPFPVTLTAKDANGYTANFNGAVALSSSVSVNPATVTFVNGLWSGNVTATQPASGASLRADDGAGHVSTTNTFDVDPPAPSPAPLPAYSPGTSRTVTWASVAGADQYFVEYAADASFAAPLGNSGWITATNYTFTGLSDGAKYYYHVKSRKIASVNAGSWTQTTQSDFTSDTFAGANATASPGAVVLNTNQTTLFAEDFENGNSNGWNVGTGAYTTRQVTNATAAGGSTYSLTMIGGSGHYNGINHSLNAIQPTQVSFSVRAGDATGAESYFVIGSSPSFAGCAAFFFMSGAGGMGLSDGANYWFVPYAANTWYNITLAMDWVGKKIDYYVNGALAFAAVPFRVTTVSSLSDVSLYNFNNAQAWWDQISFTTGNATGYVPSGNVASAPITSGSSNWGLLTFNTNTPAQTTATVDILSSTGALLAANVPSGANLATLGIAPGTIRLRCNLGTTDSTVTPSLLDWTVSWAGSVNLDSAWSAVVYSTQDATPPVVSFPGVTTGDTTPPLAGAIDDPAALVQVTVNGVTYPAINNGSGGWQLADNTIAPPLPSGTYTVVVTATDTAGNVAAASASLTILPPPSLQSMVINDGSAQRSMVKSLTLTFDQIVTLDAGAIDLVRQGGSAVAVIVSNPSGDGRTFVVTFTGAGIVGGSLADGRYNLVIHSAKVHDQYNRSPVGADSTFSFLRLFGDSDGNGTVDAIDAQAFAAAQNTRSNSPNYRWYFDYDGNGTVDGIDALRFRQHQGMTV